VGGLITVLLSGFVIFNSFYVWPKLLPAAFLVLVVALVLSDEWVEARSRITGGLACGVGAAVAMLSHEGSVLVLIPLVIVTLGSRKRWPSLRCTAGAVAGVIALILPWTLYQRYYDPPGTSLSKLQLAGTTNFDPHVGLATAIIRAYQHLSFGQIMARK
jgi:4-amino-4-deoxy-L-arabinose transferase-like glycosyltransferase